MPIAIKINPKDNVVVALHPIAKGTAVPVDNTTVTAVEDIPQGHKMAIAAIKAGDRTNAAEMLALAQHIMDGTIPPFCPHGRPCVLKITRKELEKQFGRLV